MVLPKRGVGAMFQNLLQEVVGKITEGSGMQRLLCVCQAVSYSRGFKGSDLLPPVSLFVLVCHFFFCSELRVTLTRAKQRCSDELHGDLPKPHTFQL